jgi:hypothetical protein
MKRIRSKVRELTLRSQCHEDSAAVIAKLNPVLRGWGNYFRTGNASKQCNQRDEYVWQRLRSLRVKRKGRNLHPGEVGRWSREFFWFLCLHRLRGTIGYPERAFFKEPA